MFRALRPVFLVYGILAVLVLVTGVSADGLITGVIESGTGLDPVPVSWTGQTFDHPNEGAGFTVPNLDEDVPFFTDRNHEYNGISEEESIAALGLAGVEYVMSANDNRGVADYKLDISVSQTVDAYVFMDTRVTQPQWLTDDGWGFLGYQMGIDEGGDGVGPGNAINNRFWIWKKTDIPAGTFSTFERGGSGNNNYGVAVTLPGVGPGEKEFPDSDFMPSNFGLIDIGATEGRPDLNVLVDNMAVGQIGAGVNNENGPLLEPRTMTSSLGDTFTIALDNVDETGAGVGRIDWRDRGDSVLADLAGLPLIKLAEDFVKNNNGILRVTLGDLPAGPYEVTSFHIDSDNTQCEAIKILVDNGDGSGYVDTGVLGNSNFAAGGIGGLTPDVVLSSGATFSFVADGVNPVSILFDGRAAADTEVPLAGLDIQYVPEPSSLTILLMLVLPAAGLWRRRQG